MEALRTPALGNRLAGPSHYEYELGHNISEIRMTDSLGLHNPAGTIDSDGDSFSDGLESHVDVTQNDPLHHPTGDGGLDHLHLRPHSEAVDSDGDGFSDAVEHRLGTNAMEAQAHPVVGHGRFDRSDADQDGFSDAIELRLATDPMDASSHPDIVLPHHYPANSGLNLPDTEDVVLNSWIESMP